MGAKKKTVLKSFDYMHCDDFANYLEEMAAKGWHFVEWGVGLKFEKGEAADVTYAVEIFTKAGENDTRPEPDTQEFAEYCEAAGWKFIDAKQKFCIFKKVDARAMELFTPEERVRNAFKGTFSGSAVLLLFLYGLNAVLQWMNLVIAFDQRIFSGSTWFSISVWNVMFVAQLMTFLYAVCKRGGLLKRIKAGEEIHIGTHKNGKIYLGMRDIYSTLLILMLLCYLLMLGKTELVILNVVVIAITLIFSVLIAKFRPESSLNIVIQVIFGIVLVMSIVVGTLSLSGGEEDAQSKWDKLPLKASDYREFAGEIRDINIYDDGNILGSYIACYIFSDEESMYYKVYQSEHAWILDKIWEEEMSSRFNQDALDCTSDWKAVKAVRNQIGMYYVRYADMIFELSEDAELSPEQITVIREKLDLR